MEDHRTLTFRSQPVAQAEDTINRVSAGTSRAKLDESSPLPKYSSPQDFLSARALAAAE